MALCAKKQVTGIPVGRTFCRKRCLGPKKVLQVDGQMDGGQGGPPSLRPACQVSLLRSVLSQSPKRLLWLSPCVGARGLLGAWGHS